MRPSVCRAAFALLALLSPGIALGEGGRFDPLRYFAGRTTSTGVLLRADGSVETHLSGDTHGRRNRAGETTFDQVIRYSDGKVLRRSWRVIRTGAAGVEAVATDIVGIARGDLSGDTLHLRYVLRTDASNPLFDVDFEQWLTLGPDGRTVLNHAEARKLGFLVRTVEERFTRQGRR